MYLLVWTFTDLTLMGNREIMDRKEWLIFISTVRPCGFSSTFIPYLSVLLQIVIFFFSIELQTNWRLGLKEAALECPTLARIF